jgi:ubiquinone/menaquinone biosynthesis C-methylase UbiE
MRELLELNEDAYSWVDRAAIDYDGGVHAKHRLIRYHDFFVERVRSGERVLDVGCGKGELAHDLVERAGAVVTGIDMNREYLRFARERYHDPHLEFVEADVLEYLPDAAFDVVILSNVLEHIERRPELLRRIVEQVRPSRLLLRVPVLARDWTVPLREELGLWHFSDATHFVEYDPELFHRELGQAGLEVTELVLVWGEIWAEARPRS